MVGIFWMQASPLEKAASGPLCHLANLTKSILNSFGRECVIESEGRQNCPQTRNSQTHLVWSIPQFFFPEFRPNSFSSRLGTSYIVLGTWYIVHGTSYFILGTSYIVLGTSPVLHPKILRVSPHDIPCRTRCYSVCQRGQWVW